MVKIPVRSMNADEYEIGDVVVLHKHGDSWDTHKIIKGYDVTPMNFGEVCGAPEWQEKHSVDFGVNAEGIVICNVALLAEECLYIPIFIADESKAIRGMGIEIVNLKAEIAELKAKTRQLQQQLWGLSKSIKH